MSTSAPKDVLGEEESVKAQGSRNDSSRSSIVLTFVSAGLANSISAACTNWADCIKVRQQLEMKRQRRSFVQVGVGMVRNEGALSLMNGVTASCMRELSYGLVRMGAYERFKESYAALVSPTSFANKLLAGASSGALGAAISTPTDLIKVRFQAPRPTGQPPYKNAFVAFAQIYRDGAGGGGGQSASFVNGVRSLYRGTYANVIRAMVLTSTQIGTYDEVKGLLRKTFDMREGLLLHFSSSAVAGLACSLASQPVDVIKVRIMQDRTVNGLEAVRSLLQNEGPMALYKGFGMCWARLGTHTVLSLVLFERFRALFGIKPL